MGHHKREESIKEPTSTFERRPLPSDYMAKNSTQRLSPYGYHDVINGHGVRAAQICGIRNPYPQCVDGII